MELLLDFNDRLSDTEAGLELNRGVGGRRSASLALDLPD
jgi:hypothetical protein